MNALLPLAWLLVIATPQDLQGTWQGAGPRYAGLNLVFCGDVLAARMGTEPILETRESHFDYDPEAGTIDICRAEGKQLGRYAVDGDTLRIVIGDINEPRPESMNPKLQRPI